MKKILCLGLCFMIVLCSFILCFADGGGPFILPVSDGSSGLDIPLSSGLTNRYYANSSPVYIVWTYWNNSNRVLAFSENPDAIVYWLNVDGGTPSPHALNSQYNGYYYSQSVSTLPLSDSYFLEGQFTGPSDVIDFIDSTVFSTTFDITYLVNGSVSWLTTFAQAVKNNALLLFIVLFIFVGIGIGLMQRFTRR